MRCISDISKVENIIERERGSRVRDDYARIGESRDAGVQNQKSDSLNRPRIRPL